VITVPVLVWLATILGLTFGVGLFTTLGTRTFARRVGFVAKPRAERWHKKPTALAGGVGIFVAFMSTALIVGGPVRLRLLVGATAMFALGFIDDVFQLKPYAKLVGQLVVAAFTVLGGAVLPWTSIVIIDQAISLLWIIGITNAINLLDNMDGLAGGAACIAAVFQAAFFLLQKQQAEAAVAAALAGALLGFLVFNWNPASIFMGDSGALFLGYTLATLATQNTYGRSRALLVTIAAPVLVMLVPIFDTSFVTVVRIMRGRPVSQGGRDHTSHRLVTLGLSERTAVGLLLGVGGVGGLTAVLARLNVMAGVWIGAPLIALTLAFLGIHLARTDRPLGEAAAPNLLSALAAYGYRRRIFEVCLDAVLAMIAVVAAFVLRFDGDIPTDVKRGMGQIFLIVVTAKIGMLYVARCYDGLWRHVSVTDVLRLARAAVLGSIIVFITVGIWLRFHSVSRGALIIDCILFAVLLAGSRLSFRLLRVLLVRNGASKSSGVPALLWGAGDLGEDLARQLLDNPDTGLVPVGFVDDDQLKKGRLVHGLKVHGDSSSLPDLIANGLASLVVVTSARIPPDRVAAMAALLPQGSIRRVRMLFEDVTQPDPRIGALIAPRSEDRHP
jgi:UDP-GlcNAc:undecaprenyl-phosphate GlcNAc-1-phosphate transferase